MERYLVKILQVNDAPLDSYVIYRMDPGGIFYCSRENYVSLCKYLSTVTRQNGRYAMDLSHTRGHALVFDVDVRRPSVAADAPEETRPLMLQYFDGVFLPNLKRELFPVAKHFTAIACGRTDRRGGLHVHLPEVFLTYDDYVVLCERIQVWSDCYVGERRDACVTLDIVSNFSLPNSSKPNGVPYEPVRVAYADEANATFLDVCLDDASRLQFEFQAAKKNFKRRKHNCGSFFRRLLQSGGVRDLVQTLREATMPVVPDTFRPPYQLYYPTDVVRADEAVDSSGPPSGTKTRDERVVASFLYDERISFEIRKNVVSLCVGDRDWMKCHEYFRLNSHAVTHVVTQNNAIRSWYNRFRRKGKTSQSEAVSSLVPFTDLSSDSTFFASDDAAAVAVAATAASNTAPDNPSSPHNPASPPSSTPSCSFSSPSAQAAFYLKTVQERLKSKLYSLRNADRPLRKIMTTNRSYYFLPVFYALCDQSKINSRAIVSELRPILARRNEGRGNEEEEEEEEDDEDYDEDDEDAGATVARLLDRLEQVDPKLMESVSSGFTFETIVYCGSNVGRRQDDLDRKVRSIIEDMKGHLLFLNKLDELIRAIMYIMERHMPVMRATSKQSCKKPELHHWNMLREYWHVDGEAAVERNVLYVWQRIQAVVERNATPSGFREWTARLRTQGLTVKVAANILVESTAKRKVVEIDRRKWHLRTTDGILDLITGHVGGAVPEFYMSSRKLGLELDRREMTSLIGDARLLRDYRRLTDRRVFQKYLKALFDEEKEDADFADALLRVLEATDDDDRGSDGERRAESMRRFFVHVCKYTGFEYDRLMHMLDVLGSLLVATNYERKFFLLKGVTRNGKSKFFQMICRVFGEYSYTAGSVNFKSGAGGSYSQALKAMPELASNLFSCRVIVIEELAGKLDENLIKDVTGNSTTSFRNLYEQNSGGIPTAKLMASTNGLPECTATDAFRDRVVAFPFEANFSSSPSTPSSPTTNTADRVIRETYPLETGDSVVEDSHVGFFAMMYFHFAENRDGADGMLHCRPEPEALVDFKQNILQMTDVYSQFKQYADVQVIHHCHSAMTTPDDLRSAVRQFLMKTRNASVLEEELIARFDDEFGHLKKTVFPESTYLASPDDQLRLPFSAAADEGFSNSLCKTYRPLVRRHVEEDDENEREKAEERTPKSDDAQTSSHGIPPENDEGRDAVPNKRFKCSDGEVRNRNVSATDDLDVDDDGGDIGSMNNNGNEDRLIYYDSVVILNVRKTLRSGRHMNI